MNKAFYHAGFAVRQKVYAGNGNPFSASRAGNHRKSVGAVIVAGRKMMQGASLPASYIERAIGAV
jgi:hypothetical protein